MQLKRFGDRLRHIVGTSDDARPFVCDGDPYTCRALVVGINPASSVPFWPFWSDAAGFDRHSWFECYKRARACVRLRDGRKRRQAVSSTRQRIDWIREAMIAIDAASLPPAKLLETNLYMKPTATAAELQRVDRSTEAFAFLLAELRPTVLLLHGKEVKERFEQELKCSLPGPLSSVQIDDHHMMVRTVPHLSRVSRASAAEFGQELRRLCAASR